MSSLKRKLTDSSDYSNDDHPVDQPFASRNLPPPKRRRFDLACNLSKLSLFEQAQAQGPIVQEQAVFQGSPLPSRVPHQNDNIGLWLPPDPQGLAGASMDMDGEVAIPVITHPIIEEPIESALAIPEVRMRHTSSYELEKDRIVITDLDSSEDEAETPSQTPGSDGIYSVSHTFLSRINTSKKSIPLLKVLPPKPESDSSQALVLFRPSAWSAKDANELERIYRDRDEEKPVTDNQVVPQIEEPDTDAMEIE